ncbi:formin-like protein [Paramacrobiotus metropolitanus]|uniref:formin-like protein n=1 Tax=Paramacrobiotus metropolitanus TaxID=2943436 RepID=UPI0024459A8F|nr:formin-like protein [Paramacrobiotus metropolitanus]XP_055352130.1 formin-like protein [Paramacrobiotus metropolitanus]
MLSGRGGAKKAKEMAPSVVNANGNGWSRAGSEASSSTSGRSLARGISFGGHGHGHGHAPLTVAAPAPAPPDDDEVERRLNDILKLMDLPPDKAKILRSYDSKKKWELICDQERVPQQDAPAVYLNKLRQLIDPKFLSVRAKAFTLGSKSKSKSSSNASGLATSTHTLRNLETSLRTNSIEWVREFLNDDNCGLDVLVDYLAYRLHQIKNENGGSVSGGSLNGNGHAPDAAETPERPARHGSLSGFHLGGLQHKSLRLSRSSAAKRLGQPQDDVHVCILCLRAIMNNKFGFNMVISRADTINYIALSLVHRSLRTKALVLELLAAICLVKGGHEMILAAFDHFQEVHHERHRFQTLMRYFRGYEEFNIDFMVACMQFINILVHSVECMNYRVYLQYEFTIIGLDEYLEKLKHHDSEELTTQIAAYLDNVFDVTALMKDAEIGHAAIEHVGELQDQLSHAQERVKNTENAALAKIASLESRLTDVARERDDLRSMHERTDHELNTLRRTMSQKEEEARRLLTVKNGELENLRLQANGAEPRGLLPASSAPAPPPPPPPPFGKMGGGIPPAPPVGMAVKRTGMAPPPPAPPVAGMAEAPPGALTIKRKVNTKHKLPVLNWVVLKPNQVKGTIFSELDDEKILASLDFSAFEEQFKTGSGSGKARESLGEHPEAGGMLLANGHADGVDGGGLQAPPRGRFKRVEKVSLLEPNRLRNLAIMRRNIELSTEEVVIALNGFDMRALSQDYIEVMLRISPSEEEIKKYRDYQREKPPQEQEMLTDEDKFLLQLSCQVERLGPKLQIMNFINTFQSSVSSLTPQLQAIFTASRAVRKSDKFGRVLEIVLAFGNYLNSSRRGPAYGFRLQSLEALLDLKSTDKKSTLLHYIVQTVEDKYPQLLDFDAELIFIDKAADVALENVVTDIHELEKGMEMTRREAEIKKPSGPTLLARFLEEQEARLGQLQKEKKIAEDAFVEAVEYFGESRRTIQPKDFFSSVLRFAKAFRAALEENTLKRLRMLEAAHAAGEKQTSPNGLLKTRAKKTQDAVLNELKNKAGSIKEKKLIPQEDVYHGVLEDILLGLKSEPYRRADALRRSQRRKDGAALSQVITELEL